MRKGSSSTKTNKKKTAKKQTTNEADELAQKLSALIQKDYPSVDLKTNELI